MAYRVLIWAVVGVPLVVAAALIADFDIIWERREGPVFIASNGPISEDEVRQKLMTEGWTIRTVADRQHQSEMPA